MASRFFVSLPGPADSTQVTPPSTFFLSAESAAV